VNTKQENFFTLLDNVDEPLATLPESKVRPPKHPDHAAAVPYARIPKLLV
jgi:hypothetical protein